jgi:hypothetical protein
MGGGKKPIVLVGQHHIDTPRCRKSKRRNATGHTARRWIIHDLIRLTSRPSATKRMIGAAIAWKACGGALWLAFVWRLLMIDVPKANA